MDDERPQPIFYRRGKWWHTDETWSEEFGPFETKEKAEESLKRYIQYLETGV